MSIFSEHRKFLESFDTYPMRSKSSPTTPSVNFSINKELTGNNPLTSELYFFLDKESFQLIHDVSKMGYDVYRLMEDLCILEIDLYSMYPEVLALYPKRTKYLMLKNNGAKNIDEEVRIGNATPLTKNELNRINFDEYEYYSHGMSLNPNYNNQIVKWIDLGFIN